MIRAEALSRRFGKFVAVEGLDLDIPKGEVFGLLGPNGAGKTTTVRLLTGVIAPSSGSAVVAGHSVLDAPERVRACVGLLTETPGLYVRLDAMENLRFFAELFDVSNIEIRIRSVLQRLDLWDRRHDAVGGWSKGMRQRLAIARAILHEPEVLFLDEPTSALDPLAARTVRELVSELRRDGRTIVLCTHNLDEAERLCDRIGVLKTRLLRVDTPTALRRAHEGARTAIRLRDPRDELLAVARALPFVREATLEGAVLRVAIDEPEIHHPALIRALVLADAAILAVTDETRTLEQVYLDLVGDPS